MRIIQLTKVPREVRPDEYLSDDPTENRLPEPEPAAPVAVNVESIRCFYPRRENKPGTRITFNDGGGFAVTQSYDEIRQLVMPS
jgi:hypothetical protein